MSDFINWDEIHAELGAQNKAQSAAAEARSDCRVKRQITAGLRDKDGSWIGQEALTQDDEEDEDQ
jgi:hypothetical protein